MIFWSILSYIELIKHILVQLVSRSNLNQLTEASKANKQNTIPKPELATANQMKSDTSVGMNNGELALSENLTNHSPYSWARIPPEE